MRLKSLIFSLAFLEMHLYLSGFVVLFFFLFLSPGFNGTICIFV